MRTRKDGTKTVTIPTDSPPGRGGREAEGVVPALAVSITVAQPQRREVSVSLFSILWQHYESCFSQCFVAVLFGYMDDASFRAPAIVPSTVVPPNNARIASAGRLHYTGGLHYTGERSSPLLVGRSMRIISARY